MITRCEYCRQMSDGLECRKCGAPLRLDPRYTIGSQPVHVATHISDEFPEERARQVRDAALLNYGRRTKIDEVFPYPAWISRSLPNWRIHGEANEPRG